jgi:hypothetical protein
MRGAFPPLDLRAVCCESQIMSRKKQNEEELTLVRAIRVVERRQTFISRRPWALHEDLDGGSQNFFLSRPIYISRRVPA